MYPSSFSGKPHAAGSLPPHAQPPRAPLPAAPSPQDRPQHSSGHRQQQQQQHQHRPQQQQPQQQQQQQQGPIVDEPQQVTDPVPGMRRLMVVLRRSGGLDRGKLHMLQDTIASLDPVRVCAFAALVEALVGARLLSVDLSFFWPRRCCLRSCMSLCSLSLSLLAWFPLCLRPGCDRARDFRAAGDCATALRA